MARKWKLPDASAYLIERHTAIDELLSKSGSPAAEIAVALSSMLPSTSDQSWFECDLFQKYCNQVRTKGSLNIVELLTQVDKEFVEFAPVLKIHSPAKTLVQSLTEATAQNPTL